MTYFVTLCDISMPRHYQRLPTPTYMAAISPTNSCILLTLVYIVYIELSAYAPCGAKDRLLKARLDGSVLVESMYEEEGF